MTRTPILAHSVSNFLNKQVHFFRLEIIRGASERDRTTGLLIANQLN
jgi:hypothetical protein